LNLEPRQSRIDKGMLLGNKGMLFLNKGMLLQK
jgi:hypothetical protein